MPVYFQQPYRKLRELAWVYLHLNNVSARPFLAENMLIFQRKLMDLQRSQV